jgi:hypothetical protein
MPIAPINTYTQEVDASKKVIIPHVGPFQPIPEISLQPKGLSEIFAKDTLNVAPSDFLSIEPSKPRLIEPQNLSLRVLDFQMKFDETLEEQYTQNQSHFETQNAYFEKLVQANMKAMQEVMQKKASQATWHTAQAIATTTSILCASAATIATGGAGVTAFVLVSGGLTLTHTAMKHFGGWEALSQKLSQDPKKQENIQHAFEWSCQGMAIFFGLAGLGGTLASTAAQTWIQNAAKLGKQGTVFLSTLTQISSGASDMKVYSSQVKQLETESLLFQQSNDKSAFGRSVENLLSIEESVAEKTREIVRSRSQLIKQITSEA